MFTRLPGVSARRPVGPAWLALHHNARLLSQRRFWLGVVCDVWLPSHSGSPRWGRMVTRQSPAWGFRVHCIARRRPSARLHSVARLGQSQASLASSASGPRPCNGASHRLVLWPWLLSSSLASESLGSPAPRLAFTTLTLAHAPHPDFIRLAGARAGARLPSSVVRGRRWPAARPAGGPRLHSPPSGSGKTSLNSPGPRPAFHLPCTVSFASFFFTQARLALPGAPAWLRPGRRRGQTRTSFSSESLRPRLDLNCLARAVAGFTRLPRAAAKLHSLCLAAILARAAARPDFTRFARLHSPSRTAARLQSDLPLPAAIRLHFA